MKKLSKTYLKAAKYLSKRRPITKGLSEGQYIKLKRSASCCNAILIASASLNGDNADLEHTLLKFFRDFYRQYNPNGFEKCYYWPDFSPESQAERVLVLCFMAAIAEDMENK